MNNYMELVQKLDTSEPGVYVVKVSSKLTIEAMESISSKLSDIINEFAPGSKVILLDDQFDYVAVLTDDYMEGLGYVRKDSK